MIDENDASFWKKMFEMERAQCDKLRSVVQEVIDDEDAICKGRVSDNIEKLRKALEDSE